MAESPKLPAEQVLPAALALHWREEPLPGRVTRGYGLPREALVGELAHPVTPIDGTAQVAMRYFVLRLADSRGAATESVRVFPAYVRTDRATLEAVWPPGRRQALLSSGLLESPQRLRTLTYGELFAIKGLGAKMIIEMGLRVEALRSPWGETALEAPGPLGEEGLAALARIAAAAGAQVVSGADKRLARWIPDNGEPLAAIARALIDSEQHSGSAAVPDGAGGLITGPVDVCAWVGHIESELARIESLTLEDSLAELFELYTGYLGQRREALMSRLGWVGRRLALAEAGRMVGVTRERLRQVEEVARARLPAAALYIPALSRAVEALQEAAPVEVDRAAQLLKERGISATAYSPDGVIAAATDLYFETALNIEEARGFRVVTRDQGLTAAILYSARRMAGHKGVGCAADVAADVVSRVQGAQCLAQDVVAALRASPRFLLLCGSWYWANDLPTHRNGLAKLCSDMLSVTPELAVTQLWDGLKRYYTFFNTRTNGSSCTHLPPLEVVRQFLRAHPDFSLGADDRVAPVRPLDYREQLQPTQCAMVEALRSAPNCVMDRPALVRECERQGVSVQMVRRELKFGFLFARVSAKAWTLIGGPAAAAEAHPKAADWIAALDAEVDAEAIAD